MHVLPLFVLFLFYFCPESFSSEIRRRRSPGHVAIVPRAQKPAQLRSAPIALCYSAVFIIIIKHALHPRNETSNEGSIKGDQGEGSDPNHWRLKMTYPDAFVPKSTARCTAESKKKWNSKKFWFPINQWSKFGINGTKTCRHLVRGRRMLQTTIPVLFLRFCF